MPTETFSATGSRPSWTVPDGVSQATFTLYGAGGSPGNGSGDVDNGSGSAGGYAQTTISVSPGETYYIYVGETTGSDAGGWPNGGDGGSITGDFDTASGGGGGGRTDVRSTTSSSDIIAIAAGGGGGASARDVLSDSGAGNGGDGGGSSGDNGTSPNQSYVTAGGGAGTSCGGPTQAGADGESEADADNFNVAASGAAGGGYCGGGAGTAYADGSRCYAAGGGGGSGIVNTGSNTTTTTGGGNSGNGEVVIEYPQAPTAPENVAQSVVGDEEIDVSWDEGSTGGSADDYDVQVSEDGGSYSQVTNTTSTSITYAATASTNEHTFRVRANNSDGSSDWTTTETVGTDPTNPAVTGTAQSEISIAWDGVRDASGYEVFRAKASGSQVSDYTAVATPSTSPHSDTGLEDGERYYYRVRATYAGKASQPTAEIDATTPVPAPTIDALDTTTAREITVEYTLPDDSPDGDLTIDRSTDGGSTWTTVATVSDLSLISYTDSGLLDGEQYTYRLTRSTDHTSSQSGTPAAITILPAPTDLTHPSVGDTTADYAWAANHNNGDTRVEYRQADTSTWQTYATVGRLTESETVDGLLNGEAYESRVVAQTPHAETEDQ